MKAWNSTLRPGKPLKRSPMRRSAPKRRAGHNKAYLDACRGELCFIRIPGVCIGGMETTVPAHSNQARHGKGMGLKADDKYTVPACFACHAQLDQGRMFSREEKFALWDSAYSAWVPAREKKLRAKSAAQIAGNKKTVVNGVSAPPTAFLNQSKVVTA